MFCNFCGTCTNVVTALTMDICYFLGDCETIDGMSNKGRLWPEGAKKHFYKRGPLIKRQTGPDGRTNGQTNPI